jgi:hypothetical protein
MSSISPCVACGACCAHYRVSFHWIECQGSGGLVPDDLVEVVNPSRVAMKGTCGSKPRCESLQGEIGVSVACGIYEQRSEPCRDFDASWSAGEHNPRCDTARAAHGLSPLTPQDHSILIPLKEVGQVAYS